MNSTELPAFVAELETTNPSAGHFTDTCPLDKRFTAVYVEHSLIAMAETLQKADQLVMKLNAVPALLALVWQLQGENAALQALATGLVNERNKGNE